MSTNYNLRLDEDLKKRAFAVIEDFGLTPSQAIRLLLKQIADTGSIPLSFEKRPLQPSTSSLQALAELENGDTTTYDSPEEAMQAMLELACES